MMRFQLLFFWSLLSVLFSACESDDEDSDDSGNWIKYSDFEGETRSGAIAFTIGKYSYVGLGSNGDEYLNDFWRYDPSENFWQQMAPFPGSGRIASVSFSMNGKGYIGTGYNNDLDIEELGDFWEYDPESNSWTQKSDFLGGARYSAVGFSIGGKGYIGTGYNGSFLKDFWKYDDETDSWSQVVSLYGSKRENALAFVIGDKAFVGTGQNNGSYLYDFWAYDPNVNSWEELTLYDDDDYFDEYRAAVARYGASSFVIDDIGYIVAGTSSSITNTVYSFDPSSGVWTEDIQALEGASRTDAVGFTLLNVGYICSGRNGSQRFDDIWGFYPDQEYNEYD